MNKTYRVANGRLLLWRVAVGFVFDHRDTVGMPVRGLARFWRSSS